MGNIQNTRNTQNHHSSHWVQIWDKNEDSRLYRATICKGEKEKETVSGSDPNHQARIFVSINEHIQQGHSLKSPFPKAAESWGSYAGPEPSKGVGLSLSAKTFLSSWGTSLPLQPVASPTDTDDKLQGRTTGPIPPPNVPPTFLPGGSQLLQNFPDSASHTLIFFF